MQITNRNVASGMFLALIFFCWLFKPTERKVSEVPKDVTEIGVKEQTEETFGTCDVTADNVKPKSVTSDSKLKE